MQDPLIILAGSVICLLGAAALWYGAGVVVRARCDAKARRDTIGRGRLMLTYDDGPGRSATPALLDLLRERGVKATFFLIGESAAREPELVRRIAAEGHTIGWHSQSHRNQWKTNPIRAIADVWKLDPLLSRGQTRATVFRPPYGKMNLGTVLAVGIRRLPILTWTHVSGDTYRKLPETASIIESVRRSGGGVILMHDMDRGDPDRHDFVLKLTDELVTLAGDQGWTVSSGPDSV